MALPLSSSSSSSSSSSRVGPAARGNSRSALSLRLALDLRLHHRATAHAAPSSNGREGRSSDNSLRAAARDDGLPSPSAPGPGGPRPMSRLHMLPGEELELLWAGYQELRERGDKMERVLLDLQASVAALQKQQQRAQEALALAGKSNKRPAVDVVARFAALWTSLIAINVVGAVARWNTTFFVPSTVAAKGSALYNFFQITLPNLIVPMFNTLVVVSILFVPLWRTMVHHISA